MNFDQFQAKIKKTLLDLGEDQYGTIKIDVISSKIEPRIIPMPQDTGVETEFKTREKIAILATVKIYIDR